MSKSFVSDNGPNDWENNVHTLVGFNEPRDLGVLTLVSVLISNKVISGRHEDMMDVPMDLSTKQNFVGNDALTKCCRAPVMVDWWFVLLKFAFMMIGGLFWKVASSRIVWQVGGCVRSILSAYPVNFDIPELRTILFKGGGDDTNSFTVLFDNHSQFLVLHLISRNEAYMDILTCGVWFISWCKAYGIAIVRNIWIVAWNGGLRNFVGSCCMKVYNTCSGSRTRCSNSRSLKEAYEFPKITNECGWTLVDVMIRLYLFYMGLELFETCDTSTLTYGTSLC